MKYLKLLRVKHYIKNLLVFLPLFFNGSILNIPILLTSILGFFAFSFISSSIYILNDICDIENDKKHPVKKSRPLASGAVSLKTANILFVFCTLSAILISMSIGKLPATLLLLLYFFLNIAYSKGLKNQPIIDVVILSSGFVLRVYYGGLISNIEISKWLFLVIVTGSLFMGLGKRRNEIEKNTDTRDVLKKYNYTFLNNNMYLCVALTDVFYALWTMDMGNPKMSITIPLFIIILMRYSYNLECNSTGDPVEVILHDFVLIGIVTITILLMFLFIYIN